MYFVLGISFIFTFLFVINAAATGAAIGLWRIVENRVQRTWSARRRADFILTLRVFPTAGAIIFVAAFLIPAFLMFEPRSSKEIVGFVQAVISIISVAGVLTAFYRIFQTRKATRRLVSGWRQGGSEPVVIDGVPIPVYCISHPFPVIAVVGIMRPQMFIAQQIFDHLTDEELQAVIAHENGHLAARDNLKRTLLNVCRDLLVFRVGRALDHEWAVSSEASADEYAAQTGGKPTAINLAAALVKIARIIPRGAKPTKPAGAYLIEAQAAPVAFRVEELIKISERDITPSKSGKTIQVVVYSLFCLAIILMLTADRDFLRKIYDALEVIVTFQQ